VIEPDQVPVPVAEAEAGRVDMTPNSSIVELDAGTVSDGVEQGGETVDRPEIDQRGAGGPERGFAHCAQLHERIVTDRLTEMNSGDGQVQCGLFLRLQTEVGEIVGVGVDPVPELILPADRHHLHRDPLVPQQSLVTFERLTPGAVGVGIAGHAVGYLPQAQGTRGVQQHQQQVGHPLESIESRHRRQSRADRTVR
jgi:hypothetical protein